MLSELKCDGNTLFFNAGLLASELGGHMWRLTGGAGCTDYFRKQ